MAGHGYERPIGGGQSVTALPRCSDVDPLGYGDRVIDLDAKVSDRALHLGMAKEQLNRANVSCSCVDQALVRIDLGLHCHNPRCCTRA